jgi:membrane protein
MPEQKASPWKLGGLRISELGRRTWAEANEDDVFGRSAQLAYYFFFAIFPLAIFLIAIFGMVVGGSSAQEQLVNYLTRAVPSSASDIVRQTVEHSIQASGGGKLTLGILLALISASAGILAVMSALNIVYEVREGRSFIKQRGTAIGLTVATGVLVLIAVLLFTVGSNLAHHIAGGALYWVWNIAQYPVAIAFLLLSYSLVYHYAPNVEHPEWHWITPGAAVGVFLWIIASLGLRVYLRFFNSYSATYGMLGTVMILLLWFYVSGMALLIGGEVNAIIERAGTARGRQAEEQVSRQRPAA